jgi:UDP-glucose 4-epimerase
LTVNVLGSANVLKAASLTPTVERVVCLSSSEIYGVRATNVKESHPASILPAFDPRWSYATSKLASEAFALAYLREASLPVTVVRPFNVYGPGQFGEGAVAHFIRRALRQEPIQIRGNGRQIRAWCYVDDFVDGVLRAALTPEGVGEIFNIGNPLAVETTVGLAQRIIGRASSRSHVEFVPGGVDVEARVPDIDRAQELLGFEPSVGLDHGIDRSITWFRQLSE